MIQESFSGNAEQGIFQAVSGSTRLPVSRDDLCAEEGHSGNTLAQPVEGALAEPGACRCLPEKVEGEAEKRFAWWTLFQNHQAGLSTKLARAQGAGGEK